MNAGKKSRLTLNGFYESGDFLSTSDIAEQYEYKLELACT